MKLLESQLKVPTNDGQLAAKNEIDALKPIFEREREQCLELRGCGGRGTETRRKIEIRVFGVHERKSRRKTSTPSPHP